MGEEARTRASRWSRRARQATVAAVAVLCVVSLGCEEAMPEPEPLSLVYLRWAGPEAPLPANSSMFLYIVTGEYFSPDDVQCTVAGVPGSHVVLGQTPEASATTEVRELTSRGAPAWDSPAVEAGTHPRVLLWTPARSMPVGQASVQFGVRREDDWWWRATRPSLEPEGATTIVEADHLPPEIPIVTLGRPARKGSMEPLRGDEEANEVALQILAEEPLRWDLLRVTTAGSHVKLGRVRMGRNPYVNIRQRPHAGYVWGEGETDRREPLVVALENIVDLSGNRAAAASVTVHMAKGK